MNKPSLTLGINTALGAGSLALLEGKRVLNSFCGDRSLSLRGENVFKVIDNLLLESNVLIRDLKLVVVATGPGSFTGIRLGMSVANGLALGTGCQIFGVSILESLTNLTRESGSVLTFCSGLQDKYFWREYLICDGNKIPMQLSQGKEGDPVKMISKLHEVEKRNIKIFCDKTSYQILLEKIKLISNSKMLFENIICASDNEGELIARYASSKKDFINSQFEPEYF